MVTAKRGRAMWYRTSKAESRPPVFAGMLTSPPEGKIGIAKAKMRMNRIPNTHGGTTVVVIERTLRPRSITDSAFRALLKPSQIPIPADKNEAVVKSKIVLGKRSKMISPTLYEPDELVTLVDSPKWNVMRSQVKRNDFGKNGCVNPRASKAPRKVLLKVAFCSSGGRRLKFGSRFSSCRTSYRPCCVRSLSR